MSFCRELYCFQINSSYNLTMCPLGRLGDLVVVLECTMSRQARHGLRVELVETVLKSY